MSESIEEILAEVRSDCLVLRKYGHAASADAFETLLDRIEAAAEPYMTWLSEEAAIERSGRTQKWLRARYESWEKVGYARRSGSKREYLQPIIPARAELRLVAAAASEIYVILRGDGALVKIGVSTNVEQRISDFRRASGGNLELLLRMPGVRADEQELHRRFAEYRKHGEWFSYTRGLKKWVEEMHAEQRASA